MNNKFYFITCIKDVFDINIGDKFCIGKNKIDPLMEIYLNEYKFIRPDHFRRIDIHRTRLINDIINENN